VASSRGQSTLRRSPCITARAVSLRPPRRTTRHEHTSFGRHGYAPTRRFVDLNRSISFCNAVSFALTCSCPLRICRIRTKAWPSVCVQRGAFGCVAGSWISCGLRVSNVSSGGPRERQILLVAGPRNHHSLQEVAIVWRPRAIAQESVDSHVLAVLWASAALERAIRRVAPEVIVAPHLAVVVTDARYYSRLSRNVFRFLPLQLTSRDLDRMHGTNERIGVVRTKPPPNLSSDGDRVGGRLKRGGGGVVESACHCAEPVCADGVCQDWRTHALRMRPRTARRPRRQQSCSARLRARSSGSRPAADDGGMLTAPRSRVLGELFRLHRLRQRLPAKELV
jgi:hypothetical protein